MNTDITVLKSLVAVRLDVAIWSARRKLTAADFGSTHLPPEKLASLGSKKICDPDALKVFATLKGRAVSLLDRIGVRFLGGWAVPESRVKDVIEGLRSIEQEYLRAKSAFLAHYDDAVRRWIAENPGWEDLIKRSVVGIDTVRSRIGFGWQVFQVAPPKKSSRAFGQGSLIDEVTNLGDTLFGEVAKAANETWAKTYAGKTEVTQKALSPLRTLRAKLAGLSFVEPRVSPVVDLLDAAFGQLPDKGPIDGASLVMLQGLVCLLRDPQALAEHGRMMIEGRSSDAILHGLVSGAPVVEAEDPESETDPDEAFPASAPLPVTPTQPQLDSYGLW